MSREGKDIFPWGDGRRFNSYSAFMKRHFGGRIQKVSIDAGFTCPNRDGTRGSGGCTYCNNDAFSPSYCTPRKSISAQIEEGIAFHRKRYRRATGYLAYFQAYSNTYAPVEQLDRLYSEALAFPEVKGLVIGTRPDCIDEEKLDLLKVIAARSYVKVEYGVESCYDDTLRRINRGHTFSESVRAIEMTSAAGIHTGAHFILGLPGESRSQILGYAPAISSLPLTTVKFHQLQIIKDTPMEAEYRENPGNFVMFSFDDYMEFFIDFLELLTPSMIVERFTGEAPPRMVIAPGWGMKRSDEIMNLFERRLEERDTWQGRLFNPENNIQKGAS
jgi:radical SAM protein (TIGR01212 family)